MTPPVPPRPNRKPYAAPVASLLGDLGGRLRALGAHFGPDAADQTS